MNSKKIGNPDNLKEIKKTTETGNMSDRTTAENINGMNNKTSIDRTLERYYENPCQETFFQICEELVRAQYFDITVICSFESREIGMGYKLFPTPDYGYANIVYSSLGKNPEMKEPESYVFVHW